MRTIEQIVTDTKKPGEAILASLTPEKCDLWHAGTLLACELAELGAAVEGCGDITEEVGDALYAAEMIERHVGVTESGCTIDQLWHQVTDDFLSPIKAHCIYGKELNRGLVSQAVAQVKRAIGILCNRKGISERDAIGALDAKLAKRYSAGYSDQNAIERKDKA